MSYDIKRGDIFYIDRFGVQTGNEQIPGRPGIVVSNDLNNKYSGTVEVVYLTTQPKAELATHVTIRSSQKVSTALCEQVTTVSVERLGDWVATCTADEMFEIDIALLKSLDINIPELKKQLNAKLEIAAQESAKQPPVTAAEENIARYKMEAEMYKNLYQELLNRLLPAK